MRSHIHTVKARDSRNKEYLVVTDDWPKFCPMCKVSILPIFITGTHTQTEHETVSECLAQLVFKCPHCDRLFIGDYRKPSYGPSGDESYHLRKIEPQWFPEMSFDDDIMKLSRMYCEIIQQSTEAEIRNLTQICGAGYRRALEFLIKDYLKSIKPATERSVIETTALGNLIEHHISDANIRECAKRAVWLGNDETHYLRKWNESDIDDLKRLLRLTGRWIQNNIDTNRYISKMPEKK